jgi:hypothetical protein
MEEVDETILLQVDEEDEHESFEHQPFSTTRRKKNQIVTSKITKENPTQPWIHGTTALWTLS